MVTPSTVAFSKPSSQASEDTQDLWRSRVWTDSHGSRHLVPNHLSHDKAIHNSEHRRNVSGQIIMIDEQSHKLKTGRKDSNLVRAH